MTYLVLRLETLGNVAMTVPVITSVAGCYPEHRFVVVAKKPLAAMFHGLRNVDYIEAKLRYPGDYIHLRRMLSAFHIDGIIDLQDNLTTHLLTARWQLERIPVTRIRYGRWSKRRITLTGAKRSAPLISEFERYADTFVRAGLMADLNFRAIPIDTNAVARVQERFGSPEGKEWIGIAPFAKSKSNMLPYRITKELITSLAARRDTRIFLFGAGTIECEMLHQWEGLGDNITSVAGALTLSEELELMRQLRVMICMDSANQHLSSLVGLRAVSIWCGTHPHIGFSAWHQLPSDIIQIPHLACRPCTIHGTNHCRFLNYACRNITSQQIIQHIYE